VSLLLLLAFPLAVLCQIVAGAASAGGMAAIFLLQALSTVVPSEALYAVAFDLLGDLPERVLIAVLLVALIATCLHLSRGTSRWLGLLALLCVVGLHAWRLYAQSTGIPQPAELRLVYLLPFVWLLLASRQPRPAPSLGTLPVRGLIA
jgi:hypothetical protein